ADVASTAAHWKAKDSLCRFRQDQPYLVRDSSPCEESDNRRVESANPQSNNGTLRISFQLASSKHSVNGAGHAAFEISFASILNELAFPESFEIYFIADPTGRIVYDGFSAHLRPLRNGGWLNELIAGSNVDPGPSRRIGDLASLTDPAGRKISLDQFKG